MLAEIAEILNSGLCILKIENITFPSTYAVISFMSLLDKYTPVATSPTSSPSVTSSPMTDNPKRNREKV